MNLSGARTLVTGGSEGIGYGIAEALVAKGARVAIMGRNPKKLAAAATRLGITGIQGDVSVEADAQAAVSQLASDRQTVAAPGSPDSCHRNAVGTGGHPPVRHQHDI